LLDQKTDHSYDLTTKEFVMSNQVGSGRTGDWENRQNQQQQQQQGGYLNDSYSTQKSKKSAIKQEVPKTTVVKVWHEGAD
jgi:hypothetical protein